MKNIHLLCNAHIDPVWLWKRNEGMAEAISTFRIAADFCEQYDDFVFNHNESLLYEWVEEYEPELFERIKNLVKQGKWHIMGGWYLQPDCLIPNGESLLSQIEVGNKYFYEKFGIKPTTAINFDPFGHSRGLVQILKKSGYDSYVFMRPENYVPEHDFIWKGYDGSEIIGHSMFEVYSTRMGEACDRVEKGVEDGARLILWGIGNHGGGPSRIDLENINEYIKKSGLPIEHSWCEKYFDGVDKTTLRTIDSSLTHVMVGCYTSMVDIKQTHRAMENELNLCRKLIALSGITYDKNEMEKAVKAMLFAEFHDILPGSMIKSGETESLRIMNYGREILATLTEKAFFKLCQGQKKAILGEVPILVFNPNPYKISQDIEVEFQIPLRNDTPHQVTLCSVYDKDGNVLPTQNEKEESTIHTDWRKRIAFHAELEPMSLNRFDCTFKTENLKMRPIEACQEDETHYIVKNDSMTVKINKTTGLIDKYEVDGKDYIKGNSARIGVYNDNEDPWGMTVDSFNDKIGDFKLLSKEEANVFNGYPNENIENVRIIENGSVRTKIQAIFGFSKSYAVVTYTIPKNGSFIDIKVRFYSNDVNRFYKLEFDTNICDGDFTGQSVFGKEHLLKGGKEVTFQKWCALEGGGMFFGILNKGTYAGSSDGSTVNLSLLRTPVYAAHPVDDRPIADSDRHLDHIDMGEREFEYRLTVNGEDVESEAEIYNQQPYSLSFFPSGQGEKKDTTVRIDNKNIILSRLEKVEDGIKLHLFNSADSSEKTQLVMESSSFEVEFTPFELKSLIYDGKLNEAEL